MIQFTETREQAHVLAGMFSAMLFILLYLCLTLTFLEIPVPTVYTEEDILGFCLKWLTLPALTLLFGVAILANQRFYSKEIIDGSPPKAGSPADINRRYIQNTLEQVTLFTLVFIPFCLWVPEPNLPLVPLLCILFVIGRFAFWIGYHLHPMARSFGFGVTFYPTVGMMVFNLMELFGYSLVNG